jgi:hypothetical protein
MSKQGANDGQVWAKRRRAAVLRFMTHLNQVGQTGSTPHHELGCQLRLSARQDRRAVRRRRVRSDAPCEPAAEGVISCSAGDLVCAPKGLVTSGGRTHSNS